MAARTLPVNLYANVVTLPSVASRPTALARKLAGDINRDTERKQKQLVDRLAIALDRIEEAQERLKIRANALTKRANRFGERAELLERLIVLEMQEADVTQLAGNARTLKTQLAPFALEVVDEKLIPADYMRAPKPGKPAPSKDALKQAFLADEKLDPELYGCKLTRRTLLVRQ